MWSKSDWPQNKRGGVNLGNEGPWRSDEWKKLINEDRVHLDEADDARRAVGFYEDPFDESEASGICWVSIDRHT